MWVSSAKGEYLYPYPVPSLGPGLEGTGDQVLTLGRCKVVEISTSENMVQRILSISIKESGNIIEGAG